MSDPLIAFSEFLSHLLLLVKRRLRGVCLRCGEPKIHWRDGVRVCPYCELFPPYPKAPEAA